MTTRKVRLEDLVGTLVRDKDGVRVGRIREVHAEREGDDCVVREYRLGSAALLARFGISALRLAGLPSRREPLCVPWDLLDLTDPERPVLRCAKEELGARSRR